MTVNIDKLYNERVIDNRKLKMIEAIEELLPESRQLDIAVGYFYLSGFELIYDAFQNLMEKPSAKIRVLMGSKTNLETYSLLAQGNTPENEVISDARKLALENQIKLYDIIRWMREKRIEVKVYTGNANYFHAKSYLFHRGTDKKRGYAIVGSSNFSYNGLTGNTELNTMSQDNFYALSNWFDEIWSGDEVENFSPELLKVVEGNLPQASKDRLYYLSSRATYLEFAKRYAQPLLTIDTGEYMETLYPHQKIGVAEVKNRLIQFGTAVLADGVGLGKTRTAAATIKSLGNLETLIIVAAKLQKQWREELATVGCDMTKIHFVSKEELSRMNASNLKKFTCFKLIIVDEAHQGLKNSSTKLYRGIEYILQQAESSILGLLLTATPWNNSRRDVYNLGRLFLDIQRVSSARTYFQYLHYTSRKAAKAFELDDEAFKEFWTDIFLQRTRRTYGGKEVSFATRKFPMVTITYEPGKEKAFQANYERISKLSLPHMDPLRYIGEGGEFTSDRLKLLFLKRADSSWVAFRQTLNNLENKLQDLVNDLNYVERAEDPKKVLHMQLARWYKLDERFEGNLFSLQEYEDDHNELTAYEIISRENKVRYVKRMLEQIEKIDKKMAKKMVNSMLNDAHRDLLVLESIREDLEEAFARKDEKYEAVRDTLLSNVRNREKILIITQFRDTAVDYFERFLEDTKLKGIRIALVTGKTEDSRIGNSQTTYTKEEILYRFAPVSKKAIQYQGSSEEIDVVIGTETLSVGQNLQDARILMNLDLPYNPMTLEQRIGRIDRPRNDVQVNEVDIYTFPSMAVIEAELKMTERLRIKMQNILQDTYFDDLVLPEYEDFLKSMLRKRKAEGAEVEKMLDRTVDKYVAPVKAEQHSSAYIAAQNRLWEFLKSGEALNFNNIVDSKASFKNEGNTVFIAKTIIKDVNEREIQSFSKSYMLQDGKIISDEFVPIEQAWYEALQGYAYTTEDLPKDAALEKRRSLDDILEQITSWHVRRHNEMLEQNKALRNTLEESKTRDVTSEIKASINGPNRNFIAERIKDSGLSPASLRKLADAIMYIDRIDPEYQYVLELHENLNRLWDDYSFYYEKLADQEKIVSSSQTSAKRPDFKASMDYSVTVWEVGHISMEL